MFKNLFELSGYLLWYISILLLVIGIIVQLIYRKSSLFKWGITYFFFLLSMEASSVLLYVFGITVNTMYLRSISPFVSFSFIMYLYLNFFYKIDKKRIIVFLLISLLPLLIQFNTGHNPISYQSYDRMIYSMFLMALSMRDIYLIIAGKVSYSKLRLFLGNAILLFYSFETLVSIPSNFLLNGEQDLVLWIWSLRAIVLQCYYVALIIFIKNSGRISSSFLLDSR